MLNKDIIKRRLDEGISFTEFSYMILQALDFVHLNEKYGCTLEVAGQDQWGNITSGIELARRKNGTELYGFTMPLLTKSDGTKFGKTNGKAIWLDKTKTSPYEMYQFFINAEDEKVIDYLKFLTFLSRTEIEEIEKEQKAEPEKRIAQQALAREVITFLHGKEAYEQALKISRALFSGDIKSLTAEEIKMGFGDLPLNEISENTPLVDALITIGLAKSKRESREFITNGAVSINGDKCQDLTYTITSKDAIGNEFVVCRRGKKLYALIKVI
jgi:tyrosyl-tRNA synthetase